MSTNSSSEATGTASEATKSLLRTVVRTFFHQPKQILILDALLTYNVLHIEDIATLFHTSNTQQKEIRSLINPLKAARLVTTGTRSETKAGNTRAVQREYYYVNWHEAVDAVKYKIIKLLEKVKEQYKENDLHRKDWFCPRCKAEYDELAILDTVDPDRGFICARCGYTLVQNEAAVQERAEHQKIRQLNDQLQPFNALLAQIDAASIPANTFDEAWARKREVPKDLIVGQQGRQVWHTVERQRLEDEKRARQEVVKTENLDISIKGEKERREEEEEARRIKAGLDATQNALPVWHRESAIGLKKKDKDKNELGGAIEAQQSQDDKKAVAAIIEQAKVEEDLDDFVAQYEREQQLLAAKEAEGGSDGSDEEDEDDEDDFEDVGTPASSQQAPPSKFGTPVKANGNGFSHGNGTGLKREFDLDGESVSGTSTGGRTPIESGPTSMPSVKRVKIEEGAGDGVNGHAGGSKNGDNTAAAGEDADSDEDDDFEDV